MARAIVASPNARFSPTPPTPPSAGLGVGLFLFDDHWAFSGFGVVGLSWGLVCEISACNSIAVKSSSAPASSAPVFILGVFCATRCDEVSVANGVAGSGGASSAREVSVANGVAGSGGASSAFGVSVANGVMGAVLAAGTAVAVVACWLVLSAGVLACMTVVLAHNSCKWWWTLTRTKLSCPSAGKLMIITAWPGSSCRQCASAVATEYTRRISTPMVSVWATTRLSRSAADRLALTRTRPPSVDHSCHHSDLASVLGSRAELAGTCLRWWAGHSKQCLKSARNDASCTLNQ